jgi:uncharacterized membrane protein
VFGKFQISQCGGKTALMHGFLGGFYAFAYAAGSVICHQRPDRSFHLAGVQLPVCARCTGIYGGALLGIVVWGLWIVTSRRGRRPRPAEASARKRTALTVLAIAAAPTLITLATGFAGVWDPSNMGRAIAGLPLGLAAGALLGAIASKDIGRT